MPADRAAPELEAHRPGRDLAPLLRQIRVLTQELRLLRLRGTAEPELRAKERTLEQLRWRLAVVARRAALEDGGSS